MRGFNLENFIHSLDKSFGTRRRRHIAGGVLVSISLLFGGLALTVISLKQEEEHEQQIN
jgi:hypothetical protein